jgi:intracellular septation protein A
MMVWIGFGLKNFIVPVLFFTTFRMYGSKAAILIAVVATLIQVAVMLAKKMKIPAFFITAAGFTLLFGGTDLFLNQPQFYRLEPFAQSFVIGLAFMITLFFRLPLAEWFVDALPDQVKPRPGEVSPEYFRKLIWIWSVYFLAKAFLYLWLAFRVDLGKLIILRTIIGQVSFLLLFGGEMLWRASAKRRASRRSVRNA